MSELWERVNALFHAALERPGADQARFVTEQAGENEALREEVLSLLDAHQRAGSFLDTPAVDLQPPALPSGDEPAAHRDGLGHLTPGCTIGSYRIERELGRGGMGVVYLAEDTRLARKVALKVLAPGYSRDEQRRERLRKEARAAARLSHPGIATVFALEELDGELFITSEFVAGRTLRDELEAGEVPVDRLVDIAVQVARALAAAHGEGVVHRDLKPENIISSDQHVVKILDFGVARSVTPGVADRRLTATGVIVGTQAYMSPEQLESANVDFRSDVFSFGVLLYELATGVHPFEGSSPASTMARIMAAQPAPVSELRRQLPPDFDRIVAKCLEKEPSARYQSTLDLVVDLERLQRGDRVSGRHLAAAGGAGASGRSAPAPASQIRWWRVHQAVVVGLYAALTAAAWFATERATADWTRAAFFAAVGAAALNGTLRVHLLFTERHNRPAFRGEMRRASLWLRLSDVVFGCVLLTLAVPSARAHIAMAIVLAACGAGSIIVSVAVEPATTHAAFRTRSSGVRRKPSAREEAP
jgi:predicted Ser/Thr protein kinase